MNKKQLILITGTSGSGKNWLVEKLENELGIVNMKSYATRKKRPGETGKEYKFIDYNKVNDYIKSVFQCFVDIKTKNLYFTTVEDLERLFEFHDVVSLIITPQSVVPIAKILRPMDIDIVYIHINVPPEIRAKRMSERGDDEDSILARLRNMDKFIEDEFGKFITENNKLFEKVSYVYTSSSDVAFEELNRRLKIEGRLPGM